MGLFSIFLLAAIRRACKPIAAKASRPANAQSFLSPLSSSSLTSGSSLSVRNVKTATVTATSKAPSPTDTPIAPVKTKP